jgi:hypothetical protein
MTLTLAPARQSANAHSIEKNGTGVDIHGLTTTPT